MRLHRQDGRPGRALHARADRARGAGRPCGRRRPARRGLPARDQPVGAARRAAGARPRRRLRPRSRPAGGDQDPPRRRRAGPPAGQPPRAALGAGDDLRLAAVRARRAGADRAGAGLLRHRQPLRDGVHPHARRRDAAPALRPMLRGLSRLGAQRAESPQRARRRAGGAALSARRLPRRPAPAGRGGLPGRARRPHADGAGAHRHRQDHRHCLPAAARPARPADRPGVLPDRQDLRPRAGARRGGGIAPGRAGAAAARAGAGRPREGLRASGQGLPRRVLPAGAGLLRPAARGPRGGAGGAGLGPRRGARAGAGAPRLPLLPWPGAGALGRSGHRRLQPLSRSERDAARADPAARLAGGAAARRGAQPGGPRPADAHRRAGPDPRARPAPHRAEGAAQAARQARARLEGPERQRLRRGRGQDRRDARLPRCPTS